MELERTASPSAIDIKGRAPQPKPRFAPVADQEARIFATLKARETQAEAREKTEGRITRLPRFSLLRGEVALLAERVFSMNRSAT